MGNCVERAAASGAPRQVEEAKEEEEEEEEDMNKAPQEGGGRGGGGGGGGSCRVKLLLTRKELEWLILHLKEKGEQKLEDVLLEMSREMEKQERAKLNKGGYWRPSLDSILETPPSHSQNSSTD